MIYALLVWLAKAGYSDKFALGLVTTSGSLGLLLVPSVPLILYGIVAQQLEVGEPFTITDLFIAGIMPLLLMLGLLITWTLWHHRGGKQLPIQTDIQQRAGVRRRKRWGDTHRGRRPKPHSGFTGQRHHMCGRFG